LEIQGEHVQPADADHGLQSQRGVRHEYRPPHDDPTWYERERMPALYQHERQQACGTADAGNDNKGRRPAVPGHRGHGVDEQRQAGGNGRRAHPVQPAVVAAAVLGKHQPARQQRDHGYRNVDEKDPPPTPCLCDHTSAEHPDHKPEPGHRAVDAEGPATLALVTERRREQRE
jgi:hypothetical protein